MAEYTADDPCAHVHPLTPDDLKALQHDVHAHWLTYGGGRSVGADGPDDVRLPRETGPGDWEPPATPRSPGTAQGNTPDKDLREGY